MNAYTITVAIDVSAESIGEALAKVNQCFAQRPAGVEEHHVGEAEVWLPESGRWEPVFPERHPEA